MGLCPCAIGVSGWGFQLSPAGFCGYRGVNKRRQEGGENVVWRGSAAAGFDSSFVMEVVRKLTPVLLVLLS